MWKLNWTLWRYLITVHDESPHCLLFLCVFIYAFVFLLLWHILVINVGWTRTSAQEEGGLRLHLVSSKKNLKLLNESELQWRKHRFTVWSVSRESLFLFHLTWNWRKEETLVKMRQQETATHLNVSIIFVTLTRCNKNKIHSEKLNNSLKLYNWALSESFRKRNCLYSSSMGGGETSGLET